MRRIFAILAGLVAGYMLGGIAGAFLLEAWSSNTHDKAVEAVMTAAFVTGPIGAILAAIAAGIWSRKPRA